MLPVILVLALFLSGFAAGGQPVTTKHLTIVTSASQPTVEPGARVALNIDVAPKPTMHVYAPGQKAYIAISLKLDEQAPLKPATIQFPKPEKREVKELGETQLVYSKPFRIVQDVTLAKSPTPGPLIIKGTVRYQACDESICYTPITVPVTWTLTVKKPSPR